LRQVLLNQTLRLRERYTAVSLREEQLARIIAEAAGPLRAAAATLLDLEGQPAPSPKAALESLAKSLGGANWAQTLELMSTARESGLLSPGVAAPVVFQLMTLAKALRERAETLS
jgi:hypothetical protein